MLSMGEGEAPRWGRGQRRDGENGKRECPSEQLLQEQAGFLSHCRTSSVSSTMGCLLILRVSFVETTEARLSGSSWSWPRPLSERSLLGCEKKLSP